MCCGGTIHVCAFQSAISRYLVSNKYCRPKVDSARDVSIRYIAVLGIWHRDTLKQVVLYCGFHPLYRGTWYLTPITVFTGRPGPDGFPSAITRYLVSDMPQLVISAMQAMFPSAISRYLVSDPTRKTPPLTSGGGNGLHTPRRIDHIPTFASLNHDKNTRSTHYTPNAGIELSETTPPPLRVNPVQNHAWTGDMELWWGRVNVDTSP